MNLAPGARVEVRRGAQPVLLARLAGSDGGRAGSAPFTDRLVVKFGLPVTGWRGRAAQRTGLDAQAQGTGLDGEEGPPADA